MKKHDKTAKLYIDLGNGFHEQHALLVHFNSADTCLEFDLRSFEKVKSLRFDPCEDYVSLKIKSVKIEDDNGFHEIKPYYYSFYQKDDFLFSEDTDPFVLLTLDNIKRPSRIIFSLEYLSFGADSVHSVTRLLRVKEQYVKNVEKALSLKEDIIASRETAIRDLEARITGMENHPVWKLLKLYYKVRDEILPIGSRRRKLVKSIFSGKKA